MRVLTIVLLLVSGCVQNRTIFELDTGEVVSCREKEITACGVNLSDCEDRVEYFCNLGVRATDDS